MANLQLTLLSVHTVYFMYQESLRHDRHQAGTGENPSFKETKARFHTWKGRFAA